MTSLCSQPPICCHLGPPGGLGAFYWAWVMLGGKVREKQNWGTNTEAEVAISGEVLDSCAQIQTVARELQASSRCRSDLGKHDGG